MLTLPAFGPEALTGRSDQVARPVSNFVRRPATWTRPSAEINQQGLPSPPVYPPWPSLRWAGERRVEPPSQAQAPCRVRAVGETGATTDAEQVARGILADLQDGFVAHDVVAVTALIDDEVRRLRHGGREPGWATEQGLHRTHDRPGRHGPLELGPSGPRHVRDDDPVLRRPRNGGLRGHAGPTTRSASAIPTDLLRGRPRWKVAAKALPRIDPALLICTHRLPPDSAGAPGTFRRDHHAPGPASSKNLPVGPPSGR